MWLDVQEDGELEGGTKLMVTMNKMVEGKGRDPRGRDIGAHLLCTAQMNEGFQD